MAARIGSIEVLFRANYGALQTGANRAAASVEQNSARMDKAVKRTDRSVIGLNRTISTVRGREFRVLALSALRAQNSVDRLRQTLLATTALAGGLGAAFTLRGVQEYSDTYKEVGNRLRIVKDEAQSLESIESRIFEIAQKSRAQYKSTGVLFARIAASARRLNISQKDTLRVTETIQKAFVVGGATNVEAAQSAIQLSQGIASDRLQGDELRSVLENPALGQLLAEQISGGDLGKLRDMAKEGQLTARTIIKAFKGASEEIDRLFSETEQTVGQAFIKVDNALLKYVGQSKAVREGTSSVVLVLNAMAENFEDVADTVGLLVGAFAAFYGARAIGGAVAATQSSISAFRLQRVEMLKNAQAANTLALTQAATAKAEFLNRQVAFTAAQASGKLTAKQLSRETKKVETAQLASANASRTAKVAAAQLATTQRALTTSATLAAGATRALSGALAFVGGPVGLALLAISAAMYVTSTNAAEASERADRYSEAIKRAGSSSSDAAKGVREIADELARSGGAFSSAETSQKIDQAKADIESYVQALRQIQILSVGPDSAKIDLFNNSIRNLTRQLREGQIDLKEFVSQTDELAQMGDQFRDMAVKAQEAARGIEAAQGTVDGLTGAIDDLGTSIQQIDYAPLYAPLADVAKYLSTQREFNAGLEAERKIMLLAGDAYKVARKEQGLLSQAKSKGLELTASERASIRSQAEELVRLEGVRSANQKAERERSRLSKRGARESERLAERFAKKMNELEYKAQSVSFTDLDQEVISVARSAGVADTEIRAFIASLEGNGQAPAKLMAIKEVLKQIASAEFRQKFAEFQQSNVITFFDELDRSTISTARSFGVAEANVKAFISAVTSGDMSSVPPEIASIREELAKVADTKRINDFANSAASAFGNFAKSAITDFSNIDSALDSLASSLDDLVVQMLVIEPLKKSLSSGISSFLGGSGSDAWGGLRTVSTAHTGSKIGVDTPKGSRTISNAQIAAAPRFHDGLNSNEFAAVLLQGERVLTAQQDSDMINTMDGLSRAAMKGGGGGNAVVNIHNHGSDEVETSTRSGPNGDIVDVMIGRSIGSGRQDKAMGRYGAKPKAMRR